MNSAHALSATSPLSVLIVDDEEILLLAYAEMIEGAGYRVSSATNAAEAVKHLEREQFALVLTDQNMPGDKGLEFLSRVKQLQPDATRVLMTGVLDLSTVIEAINQGEIYRFVAKPCLREDLLVTVKNAVQRYELIRQNEALQKATREMNRELATMNQSLEQNLQHSVELCLKTMQTFYPTLGVQAKRVHELCVAMATGLDLPPHQRQILEISAWLHDVGLVGVPRPLIRMWQNNSKGLNPAELALVQQHPVMGQELASFIHHLSEVGIVIRSHHERFDGTGYPDRLTGEAIPWLGRLLAVAVGYAEHDGERCSASEMLQRESGKAFDPEAVRIFARHRPHAITRKEREVLMAELRPGMVLAKGVYTAGGLLLIPEGQSLNETYIDKLRNHDRVNPIKQLLLVYR